MAAFSTNFSRKRLRALGLGVAVAFAVILSPAGRADDDQQSQPGLSDDSSEALSKLQPLVDAKNWDGALALLDDVAAKVPPESYDMAFILDTKAKVYLQKNDVADAIAPWEADLRLNDAHHYLEPKAVLDMVYSLAGIYYQESTQTKVPEIQHEDISKSIDYMRRWVRDTPKLTEDASLFYCSLLYNEAVANSGKADAEKIRELIAEVQKGLLTSLHPKEGLYQIMVGALQQENDYAHATQYLELLVSRYPNVKGYWQTLASMYQSLAATAETEKNPFEARMYYAKEINALERARDLGVLKSPTDIYNIVALYFTAGQFGTATDLLDKGLKDKSIEASAKNWDLLAYSYQSIGQNEKAIGALKEAADDFPDNGDLDFKISQIYSQLDNTAEAYKYASQAVTKGSLEKPYAVYVFLAYAAFEAGKYDEALQAANKAATYPEAAKDTNFPLLHQTIIDTVSNRDAKAKQKAAENNL
jgi:tetratricopeptide (TPR) repeat protein